MSIGTRRVCSWLVATLCLVIIIALIITAFFDLQIGDSTSNVIVGVTAVIGLAISAISLIMNPTNTPTESSAPLPVRIRSKGRGAVAAGGSIRGNAFGKNAKVIGPISTSPSTTTPVPQGSDVSAHGSGAMSAADDIADNAIGEDSER